MMALGSRALLRLVRTAWFPFAAVLGLLLFAPLIAHGQGVDTVVVRWTAPGDDGSLGTAANYDLRFSLSQINDSNFNTATPVSGLSSPRVAGSREQITVRGLVRGTTYWFALKTRDDEGNLSSISNIVRWEWQLDTAPPGAPNGVNASRDGENVRIRWNPSPEPDLLGYRVYRATSQSGPYILASGGVITSTEFLDSNVPDGTATVWYQISAQDLNGNESARTFASVNLNETNATTAGISVAECYPNPSNVFASVNIPVTVPPGGLNDVSVEILDSGSRRVRRLDVGAMSAGTQDIVWDGKNDTGRMCAPGVYRGWVISGSERQSIRLVRVP
jgi:FlgD Ig-like domain